MLPRERAIYAASMPDVIERSFAQLAPPMRRALELAWESVCAGSLGIGAVAVSGDGVELATGRNRLFEHDPGDDVLAGSSLAHAELNVLAKLGYRRHEDDAVELFTTLQPCVQCLGAIRLSSVRTVHVLAPDPLWVGVEGMRDLTPFMARSWPEFVQVPVTEWTVWSLLLPTHTFAFWGFDFADCCDHVPGVSALAADLVGTAQLVEHAEHRSAVVDAVTSLWHELSELVAEVAVLAAATA